eukprot:TRINITY_DN32907_c0_g1_i1.p1 TRINITY_DN32907_c0_g1~~TRINITY_DN32907_c0_g1_i1.p1  ORF type:complete len:104 (+),score=13.85 TRINITY_DN32907_c0_g1_i1:45-314(+)
MRRWVQNQFAELSPADKASLIFNLVNSPAGKGHEECTDSSENCIWKFPANDDVLRQACALIKELSPNVPPLPEEVTEQIKRPKIDPVSQ